MPSKINLLHIIPATIQDIPHIIALARRIWPVAYAGVLTPEQIAGMLEDIYCRENLEQEMADGHRFWLAFDGQTPIAYASAYREDERIIRLKKIYVEPTMQGKGVGKRLTQTVIDAFRPAAELRLLANPDNTAAHAYYLRQGFRKIGEVPVRMGDWHFIDHLFAKTLKK